MATPVPIPMNTATVDNDLWRQTLETMRVMADKIAFLESQGVVIR